jgi:hypothetical protein
LQHTPPEAGEFERFVAVDAAVNASPGRKTTNSGM